MAEVKAICPKTVVGDKQGHAPDKLRLLQQILLCIGCISWRSKVCHTMKVNVVNLSHVNITASKTVECI